MIEYTREDIVSALKAIGLKNGDNLLVSTELFTLGKLMGTRSKDEYSKMILDSIFEVITKEGTVVVNTFTNYVGRYGQIYDHEHSRPTTGSFSEYVLFHPESVRSLHPLNSVAAIGKRKDDICLNVSSSNYGLGSPYDKLLKLGCQVLRLGIDYVPNSFMHVVETAYGLPYLYNKVLDVEVVVNSERIKKPFFASVRYLDITLDFTHENLKKRLNDSGIVQSASLGAGRIHRIDANEYCNLLVEMLNEDPYSLFNKPPAFKKGEIPRDGITTGRDGVHKASDYRMMR